MWEKPELIEIEQREIFKVAPVQRKDVRTMNGIEMMKEAVSYMEEHKKAFENWKEGGIDHVWLDEEGNLCIRYESKKWYHYRRKANGAVEWW